MKKTAYLIALPAVLMALMSLTSCERGRVISEREQRHDVEKGNALYAQKDYGAAAAEYDKALSLNSGNPEATFNRSLASVRLAAAEKVDSLKQNLYAEASAGWEKFANAPKSNPAIASHSAYNLGNIQMEGKQFDQAISYYKAALRIDPTDSVARRNLRIAQLNKQQQDKNKDKNQQNQQDKQDQQDKNKDQQQNQQNKEQQNQDKQNQDKQKQPQQQQNQPQPQPQQQQPQQPISKAAADRLLQRSQNKENATRAKLMKQNSNKHNPRSREKNW